MTKRIALLLIHLFLFSAMLPAQSWRKLKSQADDFFNNGNYLQAARLYEQAWQKKNKKVELIFQAGEAYFLLRDYPKAAEAYSRVKDENEEFPLVGLKYARSLKQNGQYDEAINAFESFGQGYTGEGKAILQDIIQTEIEGCQLGKSLPAQSDPNVQFVHLGAGVNTNDNDFGASFSAPDRLYFTSTVGGTARIYESQRLGESWSKGEIPGNFPVVSNGQFANGSLSADGQRMYFTICEEGIYGNLTTRCEIYYTERQGVVWSQPVRLPDYINSPGVTATHPQVLKRNDVEILYFSSNRSGGGSQGGMDIWYATRSLRTPDAAFSQPNNLGPTINTLGDEITPYYSDAEGALYFSSNGHPSAGGFDIFSAQGSLMNWRTPENIGMPYNSNADDYHYIQYNGGGFVSSNRTVDGEKTSTRDDDIFEFRSAPTAITLQGTVFDQLNGEALTQYSVTLYEQAGDGRLTQLNMINVSGQDNYSLEVLPDRRFRVEIDAPNYESGSYEFETRAGATQIYGQPVFLKQVDGQQPDEPVIDPNPPVTDPNPPVTDPDDPFVDGTPPGETYTAQGTSSFDNVAYSTNAPRYNGIYFKIQLAAVKKFNDSDSRFAALSGLGSIETEFLLDRELYRVLLAYFTDGAQAKAAMQQARSAGFPGAFIVKYEDGARYGMVKIP